MRSFSILTRGNSTALWRGTGWRGAVGGNAVGGIGGGVMGQVRGMKVRSSVKKLCEGCKVCCFGFYLVSLGFWVF